MRPEEAVGLTARDGDQAEAGRALDERQEQGAKVKPRLNRFHSQCICASEDQQLVARQNRF
jgi:hypothetical protein